MFLINVCVYSFPFPILVPFLWKCLPTTAKTTSCLLISYSFWIDASAGDTVTRPKTIFPSLPRWQMQPCNWILTKKKKKNHERKRLCNFQLSSLKRVERAPRSFTSSNIFPFVEGRVMAGAEAAALLPHVCSRYRAGCLLLEHRRPSDDTTRIGYSLYSLSSLFCRKGRVSFRLFVCFLCSFPSRSNTSDTFKN